MPPVLKQGPVAPGPRCGSGGGVSVRGQAVEGGPRVGAEPGEQRHVMGAAEDVDRVQLQLADVVDRTPQAAGVDPAVRPLSAHALRSE